MQPLPTPRQPCSEALPTTASLRSLCEQAASRLAAGDVNAAEGILGPALAAQPDDPNVLLLAGHCALARDLDDRARECFERSAALAPGFAAPLLNLGFLHRRHQRIDAARDALRRCLAITPDDPHAWMNLTATYVNEGEPAAGEAVAREALTRFPHNHAIRWNLALLLLEQAKWSDGWREYRVRFDAGMVPPPLYGADDILPSRLVSLDQIRPGQTIVCRGEQGLGDEILFAGMLDEFLTDVRRRGGTAVIDCNPRLRGVFAANFDAEVLGSGTDGAASARRSWTRSIDWVVPLGDLGGFYRTAAEQFPDRAGYLSVPPRSIAPLRDVLEQRAGGRPLVGLAWTGGSTSTHAVHRRIPLTDWLPLLRQEACFVSLQYRDCEQELHTFAGEHGIEIVSLPEITQHADYFETFRLVAALDLVVTVPTSALHVAGAIGRECWVVMHHRAAWRECSADDRIRWYPRTHRRFVRGPGEPDWSRQILRLAEALQDRLRIGT